MQPVQARALTLAACPAIARVGIEMSKVEVRFAGLRVDADVHVGGRAMPTVLNSVRNFAEVRKRAPACLSKEQRAAWRPWRRCGQHGESMGSR